MNQEPTQNHNNQFTFEHEPTPSAQPEASPAAVPSAPPAKKFSPNIKTDRTSGVAMYLFAIFSGLFTLASASYLIGNVLRHFLIEKNNSFMFFDLSSIDLYFVIATAVFGLAHFTSMQFVQKGSSNVSLGFRRRHEVVGALWQSLLAIAIIGSVITLIHAPLDNSLNGSDDGTTGGSQLTVTILSALFTLVLSGMLLWRDRTLAKGTNALIPTIVSAVMVIGVVVASVVILSLPKEKPSTPDYSGMYESSGTSDYNFESDDTSSDTRSSSN